jgi:hypothetical protein
MKLAAFIISSAFCLSLATAQEGGTIPSPRELRFQFSRDAAATSLEQETIYIQQLFRAEREAAAKGDYARAIVFRDERRAAETRLAKLKTLAEATKAPEPRVQPLVSAENQSVISLRTSAARLEGGVSLSDTGILEEWVLNAKATWDLPGLAPGGYEVVIEINSSEPNDNPVIAKEQFYSLKGRLPPTSSENFEKINIGTIRISNGSGQFSITHYGSPDDSALRIRSVELVPADS